MTRDFPFDASGCCPACGDTTDAESSLCDDCADIVRNDPRTYRTSECPCQTADEFIAREEERHADLLWSSRNAFTIHDTEWLDELKVEYGDPCGLESNAGRARPIVMTTEQLMQATIETVQQMSPEEKAKLRQQIQEENRAWTIALKMALPVSKWVN